MLVLVTLLALALVVVVVVLARVVLRELRVFRSADPDRPATLEGGGSHLTVRKGK